MMERAHRGVETTAAHYAAIRARTRNVLVYIALYFALRRLRGHAFAQLAVGSLDVGLKLARELTGRPLDPYADRAC